MSSLPLDLSGIVNSSLESWDDIPDFRHQFPYAEIRHFYQGSPQPVDGAMPIAEVYQNTTSQWCSGMASTLFFAPHLPRWSTFLMWRKVKGSNSPWDYDTVHGNLQINPHTLDEYSILDSMHPSADEEKKYTMLEVFNNIKSLGTWIFYTLSDETEHLFQLMDDVASLKNFPLQKCLTEGFTKAPCIRRHVFDSTNPPWTIPAATALSCEVSKGRPWQNTRSGKSRDSLNKNSILPPSRGPSRRKTGLPTIRRPTKYLAKKRREAEHGTPTPEDLLQHVSRRRYHLFVLTSHPFE